MLSDGLQGFHDAADGSRASEFRHPVEDMEPGSRPKHESLAEDLAKIFQWITEPLRWPVGVTTGKDFKKHGKRAVVNIVCLRKIGMRTSALVYALRPDLLPGQTAVSLAAHLGISKQAFAKHVRAFRVTFDLQTRVMRSPAAREAMKQAALKWHRERKVKA